MSDPWNGYTPPPSLVSALRTTVGIQEFDPTDMLHRKLVNALADVGPGSTLGDRISACRFVIAWELRDAADRAKTGKGNYENAVNLRVLALTEEQRAKGRRVSESLARRTAETEYFDDRMLFLAAEARATAMRQLLGALEGALENHRTDRADSRAGDRQHRDGIGSHA